MIAESTDIKQQFLEQLTAGNILTPAERDEALMALQSQKFPVNKEEYWKYTRPTKIVNSRFSQIPDNSPLIAEDYLIPGLECIPVVFVNGYLRADLSALEKLPDGVGILQRNNLPGHIAQLLQAWPRPLARDIFTSINSVFATGGLFVHVAANREIDIPLHIINVTTADDCIALPRHLFVTESGSSLKVIQTYHSKVTGRTYTNPVNELILFPNSRLDFNKIQTEQEEGLHISTDEVYQHRDSSLNFNTITLNGAFVRNNLNITIDGENCESGLSGLYLLNGHQLVDNHTLVDHRKPHSVSNELYKGILAGSSTGVFNGKVFVRQDAQKTNAFQQNNNVILSDSATMNTKPELEIYADDVKCSHGCTVGQFDEEAVFYLRSRGISENNARNLLIYAFAGEVLENITIQPLAEHVRKLINQRFDWGQA